MTTRRYSLQRESQPFRLFADVSVEPFLFTLSEIAAPEGDTNISSVTSAFASTGNRSHEISLIVKEHDDKNNKWSTVVDKQEAATNHTSMPMLFGISALMAVSLLIAFKVRFMQVSAWASRNPWTTRGIITAIHFLSAGLYFGVGRALADEGQSIPLIVPYLSAGLAGASLLFYPAKTRLLENFSKNYLTRKIHDIVLFATGAALMMHAGNHHEIITSIPAARQNVVVTIPISDDNNVSVVKKNPVKEKKGQQEPRKKRNVSNKFLLIFGSVLLMLGIAGLSCALACSGAEAAALIVLILGEVGVVLLMVHLYKRLNGTQRLERRRDVGSSAPY